MITTDGMDVMDSPGRRREMGGMGDMGIMGWVKA
jgi:hypothetical protein